MTAVVQVSRTPSTARALRRAFFAPLGFASLPCQHLQRAFDISNHGGGDTGVACCCLQLVMTKQRLDLADVDAALQ